MKYRNSCCARNLRVKNIVLAVVGCDKHSNYCECTSTHNDFALESTYTERIVMVWLCNRWKIVVSIAMSIAILTARRETITAMTITCIPVQQCSVRRHGSGWPLMAVDVCFSKSSDITKIRPRSRNAAWEQTPNERYIYIDSWESKWQQTVQRKPAANCHQYE